LGIFPLGLLLKALDLIDTSKGGEQ